MKGHRERDTDSGTHTGTHTDIYTQRHTHTQACGGNRPGDLEGSSRGEPEGARKAGGGVYGPFSALFQEHWGLRPFLAFLPWLWACGEGRAPLAGSPSSLYPCPVGGPLCTLSQVIFTSHSPSRKPGLGEAASQRANEIFTLSPQGPTCGSSTPLCPCLCVLPSLRASVHPVFSITGSSSGKEEGEA